MPQGLILPAQSLKCVLPSVYIFAWALISSGKPYRALGLQTVHNYLSLNVLAILCIQDADWPEHTDHKALGGSGTKEWLVKEAVLLPSSFRLLQFMSNECKCFW